VRATDAVGARSAVLKVPIYRTICHGLDSGRSHFAELAYTTGRVGPPLATTVYTEAVHVFCPRHASG